MHAVAIEIALDLDWRYVSDQVRTGIPGMECDTADFPLARDFQSVNGYQIAIGRYSVRASSCHGSLLSEPCDQRECAPCT